MKEALISIIESLEERIIIANNKAFTYRELGNKMYEMKNNVKAAAYQDALNMIKQAMEGQR